MYWLIKKNFALNNNSTNGVKKWGVDHQAYKDYALALVLCTFKKFKSYL